MYIKQQLSFYVDINSKTFLISKNTEYTYNWRLQPCY